MKNCSRRGRPGQSDPRLFRRKCGCSIQERYSRQPAPQRPSIHCYAGDARGQTRVWQQREERGHRSGREVDRGVGLGGGKRRKVADLRP
eukprot:2307000-Rhodomonas_salina.1